MYAFEVITHLTITDKQLNKNEPRHDKTNIVRLQPAWIQTSLRIRAG
jgi:hypothetical protein